MPHIAEGGSPGPGGTSSDGPATVHTPTFETIGQSMFGPLAAPADLDFPFTLFGVSWDESGEDGNVQNVAGFDFGARIRGATNGLSRPILVS